MSGAKLQKLFGSDGWGSTFGGAVGFVVGMFVVFATGALWKAVAWAEGLAVC